MDQILHRVSDHQMAADLSRLRLFVRNSAYSGNKSISLREPYINKVELSLHVKQVLFKLRLQLDTLYIDKKVIQFNPECMCPFCARDEDTLLHLLKNCIVTEVYRTPEVQLALHKFFNFNIVTSTEELLLVYKFSLKCFATR